eukprot:11190164-Lingulodinium_polyedra.AAC.1
MTWRPKALLAQGCVRQVLAQPAGGHLPQVDDGLLATRPVNATPLLNRMPWIPLRGEQVASWEGDRRR